MSRTVQRNVDGEITEVNLKQYGDTLHIEADEQSADLSESERGGFWQNTQSTMGDGVVAM